MVKPRGVRYFPLEQVRVIDGRPQVFAAGAYPRNLLEIHFRDGQESFGFSSKAELHSWVDNILKLMTGRSDEIHMATDLSTNGAVSVGEQWKDTVDQLKASFGMVPRKDAAVPNLDRVARKCASCSAPIAGIAGRVVRCEYCQSDQQL